MSRGDYLASRGQVGQLAPDARPFAMKGGGQIIDLFANFQHSFFDVDDVLRHLARQGVDVHRNHVRTALNHLAEKMDFLEKVKTGTRGKITLYKYRLKMTEIQREMALRGNRKRRVAVAIAARDS